MKVKNATDGPLFVSLLERTVEAGEVVEVPDFQADGTSPVVWPAPTWEPVTDAKPAARASGKADS